MSDRKWMMGWWISYALIVFWVAVIALICRAAFADGATTEKPTKGRSDCSNSVKAKSDENR